MAKVTSNVSSATVERIVAFVRKFNENEGRGCPAGAIEYIGGFSKNEIKAAKASGKLEAGKGSEGGFYPAGMKPSAKGVAVKATVKNQMAAFLRTLKEGHVINDVDAKIVEAILHNYDAQNARRRKSDD